jgi:acetolactate synthase-1/2/3 large subunit
MKASDLFIKCLEEEGIEYIFGVPGEENADLMMSLAGSTKIKFILTRHEQGAAFMAEAHGRLTGNPAVCLGTLGPGATNLITGVADANMDRAPMLVITGQAAATRRHKESHQVMDVVAMFRPVTKWNTTVFHPDTIPEIVRKAVRLSRTEKPGACHIEFPEDVAKMQTSEQPITPIRFRRPVPDDKIIDQAFELIRKAKRPIILAGNGCFRKKAVYQLREFCTKSHIPAINTFMAKGCVDMDDEFCLFTIGLQAKDVVSCALDSADVVITIGYDMVEYHPRLWNAGCNKHIIHIDFLPAEIDSCYHPEKEVIGDIAHALWMLNERLDKAGPLSFDLRQQQAVRQEMLAEFALYKDDETAPLIRPQKVLWDVRQVMGPDDISSPMSEPIKCGLPAITSAIYPIPA